MSDDFDRASDLEAADRERALRIARAATYIAPVIDCINTCVPDTLHGKKCNFYKDCLEDWELNQRMSKEGP